MKPQRRKPWTKRDVTLAVMLFKGEGHDSVSRQWLAQAHLLEWMDNRIERWMLANEYVLYAKDERGRVHYQLTTKGVLYLRSRGLWSSLMEPHFYMHAKGETYVPWTGGD